MRRKRLAAVVASGWLLTAAGIEPALAQDATRLAQEAARAQAQGNFDQAATLLAEALADTRLSNDRRAVLLADRGALLARMNQPKAAIDDLNRAVLLYAEYPAIYNNRGSILLTLGLAREAIKDFDRAILLAPGYVAAYNNRAGAKLLLGQNAAAIADFTRAIELTPDSVAPLAGRGKALLAANRPNAAMRDFSHALQIDGRLALGYRNRAEARLAADRTTEAIEDLSRAIAFEPANAALYLDRGQAHMIADNAAAALKDFGKALELDVQSVEALEARAIAHIKVDATNEAEADIQRALDLNPRSVKAMAARAMLYLKTGQPDLARREIDRAAKLAPQLPEVLLARGMIDEQAGKREDALQNYRAALLQRSTARDAGIALTRLTGVSERSEAIEMRGLGVDSWRVIRRGAQMFATSDDHPRLQVPLESVGGEAPPRLISFEVMKPPNRDIALLHIDAGQMPGASAPEEVRHVAILDLAQRTVLGVVPDRQGQRQAKWAWEDSKLVITAADGLTDEFQLRGGGRTPSAAVAATGPRRQYSEGPRTYAPPGWLPWGGQPQPQRRAGRQQPKTLLDMLFGN